MKKIFFTTLFLIFICSTLSAQVFNEKLSSEERQKLEQGEVLIRNINFEKNVSLIQKEDNYSKELIDLIDDLNPRYLAEIIQFKPYEGNEDLPKRLEEILYNVPDYAGIPYYSVRHDTWYNLYDSATITETLEYDDKKTLKADFVMAPFGLVKEEIDMFTNENEVLYIAKNTNTLKFEEKISCVWPEKMKICIYLFRDGDNWILYGIGGVNAPRIPFFTERIETSFINRIKTFCKFIFEKF